MEKFLLNEQIRHLSISEALFKQMNESDWTNDRNTEVKKFIEIYNNVLGKSIEDDLRLEKIKTFDNGNLEKRVEELYDEVMTLAEIRALNVDILVWQEDASKNIDKLGRLVSEIKKSDDNDDDEKKMWEDISKELEKVKLNNLRYDHPLCSGILELFPGIDRNTFQNQAEKYKINDNQNSQNIKKICHDFMEQQDLEQESIRSNSIQNIEFGKLLDPSEILQQMTEKILKVLENVWTLPKYRELSKVNEGSYICDILSPLLNVVLNKLPVEQTLSGIWGEKASLASAERKKSSVNAKQKKDTKKKKEQKNSSKYARKPDFTLVVMFGKTEHEILFLETGKPVSTLDKQLRDHNKLARVSKDSIDRTNKITSLKKIFKKENKDPPIFTINVTGTLMKIFVMRKKSGIYMYHLITEANIPLQFNNTNVEEVYTLIHVLFTLRTALAYTLIRISENLKTVDNMEVDEENEKKDDDDDDDSMVTVTTPY